MKVTLLFLFLSSSSYGGVINNEFYSSTFSPFYARSLPKVDNCGYVKDLFDNGIYLKTACFVHQSLSYDTAKYKCAEYNMNLFVMNNEIMASHLLDAAQE